MCRYESFFLIFCFEFCVIFLHTFFFLLILNVFFYVFGNFVPAISLLFYRTSIIYWACWVYPLYLTFSSHILQISFKEFTHVSSIANDYAVSPAFQRPETLLSATLWTLTGTSSAIWDPGAGSQQADTLSSLDPEGPFPLPFIRIHNTSAKYEWLGFTGNPRQSQKEITNLNSNSFP